VDDVIRRVDRDVGGVQLSVATQVDPAVPSLEQQRVPLLLEQLVENIAGVQAAGRREAARLHPDEVDVRNRRAGVVQRDVCFRPDESLIMRNIF